MTPPVQSPPSYRRGPAGGAGILQDYRGGTNHFAHVSRQATTVAMRSRGFVMAFWKRTYLHRFSDLLRAI